MTGPATSSPNVAVVLAGGVGTRVGLDIPKQLIKIAGHTIIEHTLKALDAHPDVDEIVVMMAPGHLDAVRAIVRNGGYEQGQAHPRGRRDPQRHDRRALEVVGDDDANVLFHDAVRPLVGARIIGECFAALDRYDAVDAAIPSADTIIEVDRGQRSATCCRGPTCAAGRPRRPSGAGTIRAAYAIADADPDFAATDDCTVVLRYLPDAPIGVVAGDERNMKVTEPIDVYIADKLFQLTSDYLAPERSPEEYREALDRADHGRLRRQLRHRGRHRRARPGSTAPRCSASAARPPGPTSSDEPTSRRGGAGPRRDRPGRLRGQHRRRAAARRPRRRPPRRRSTTSTEVNYLAPVLIAQEFFPHLQRTRGSLLLLHLQLLHPRTHAATPSTPRPRPRWSTSPRRWPTSGPRPACGSTASTPSAPARRCAPRRSAQEPPGTLLDSGEVARRSLDVLVSGETGHVIDIRKDDPL